MMQRLTMLIGILCLLMALSACSSPSPSLDDLPAGDISRGEALFVETIGTAPVCSACHALTDQGMAGPGLANYGSIAGERVDGQSALEYTYEAIVAPARHLVEGYSNLMYLGYRQQLTDQQLADLMAYLLSL